MATIKARVLSALGQDNATYLNDLDDLDIIFEEGIWEIAQTIPPRLLSTRVPQPINPSIGGTGTIPGGRDVNISNSLVFNIMRYKASADVTPTYTVKPCKEIPYEESYKAKDANSIYYATDHSPVWWKVNIGGESVIDVAPNTTGETVVNSALSTSLAGLEVFKYDKQNLGPSTIVAWAAATDYVVGDFASVTLYGTTLNYECMGAHTSTDDSNVLTGTPSSNTNWRQVYLWDAITDFINIPEELEDIIIKRIAIKCLEQKIANIGIQDEDSEVFTLLAQARGQIAEEIKGGLMMVQKQWGEKEIRGDKK